MNHTKGTAMHKAIKTNGGYEYRGYVIRKAGTGGPPAGYWGAWVITHRSLTVQKAGSLKRAKEIVDQLVAAESK